MSGTPTVHMGLPSPGTDFIDFSLDLNEFLIKNPTATFFMRLDTNMYARFGFYSQDILGVDRSVLTKNKPQVFQVENDFKIFLGDKNPPTEAIFWGTVTGLVRKV